MITIDLRYPLAYFNVLDRDLYNLITSLNGNVANSGAGFGYRDMEIDFKTQMDLRQFLIQIRDLKYLILVQIKNNPIVN